MTKKELRLKRFGTDYGGYWIPDDRELLNFGVVYDFGVGEDVSFALEIFFNYLNLDLHLFDPTPRAKTYWIETCKKTWFDPYKSKPIFHEIGVAKNNGLYDFYPPKNPLHVSHSILNLQKTTNPIRVPCYNLRTIMDILGHKELSLLKLDVEGAEQGIFDHMVEYEIWPKVLAVDSHGDMNESIDISNDARLIHKYYMVKREGDNYTFVRKDVWQS